MVNGSEGSTQVAFPCGDGVCSGWDRFEWVRDSPVFAADVERDEVVGEVEDAKHGDVEGSRAVSGSIKGRGEVEPARWGNRSFKKGLNYGL